ncbi:MAG: GTPase Era, partial [Bacteroidales bacterium]|nr:GTPase Era [Bacteroidales bacterium]
MTTPPDAAPQQAPMRAGYVSIIGNPNAGKSTLLNALIGETLSITTPKAQTTRHRILGILNGEGYQIVFSDTPGMVHPHYKLQESMLEAVEDSLSDADVFLLISDRGEEFKNTEIIEKVKASGKPVILLVNKIDLSEQAGVVRKLQELQAAWPEAELLPVSALHKFNIETVIEKILAHLPEHPAYYPEDELSDRNMRFFVSEIIREKLLLYYQKEIPYSVEVVVEAYEEKPHIDHIRALIFVEKESQKGIIIGPNGAAVKRLGTEARRRIEQFTGKKAFLEIQV